MLRRQFQRGDLLSRVWVGRVAADDERGLWLWIANGAPYLDVAAADGRSFREVPFGEWGVTAKAWRDKPWGSDVLMFHPPGGEYSVWFFFHPDGSFKDWYVNLELSQPPVGRRDGRRRRYRSTTIWTSSSPRTAPGDGRTTRSSKPT